jgi:hypothetical protein
MDYQDIIYQKRGYFGTIKLNRPGDHVIAPICASINIRFRRPAKSDANLTLTISDDECLKRNWTMQMARSLRSLR